MKALLTIALVLTSLTASAKTINLFSVRSGFADDIEAKFMVNADLGRAWVNVIIGQDWGDEYDETDNFIKIEGLSYDQETKEVVYTDGTTEVVCAAFSSRGRGIFRSTRIRNTNACSFKVTKEYRDTDD